MPPSGKSLLQLRPLDKHSILCCYLSNKPSIPQLHCYCCYQVNSLCRSSDVHPAACSSKWVPLDNNNTSLCGCPWACERLSLKTAACWGYAEWARVNCSVAPSSPEEPSLPSSAYIESHALHVLGRHFSRHQINRQGQQQRSALCVFCRRCTFLHFPFLLSQQKGGPQSYRQWKMRLLQRSVSFQPTVIRSPLIAAGE